MGSLLRRQVKAMLWGLRKSRSREASALCWPGVQETFVKEHRACTEQKPWRCSLLWEITYLSFPRC